MDTENKRRSVVGIYGLRTVPPVADSTTSSAKRRHTANLYAMEPQYRRSGFWVPEELTGNTPDWKSDEDSSQTWVQDENGDTSWEPVYKVDE